MRATEGTKQRWTCEWQGEKISVKAERTGSEVTQRLFLNGTVIASEKTPPHRPLYLCARAELQGQSRIIEAPLGPTGCKLYVDGKQVGGDEVKFRVPEPPIWEEVRAQGRPRFLLQHAAKPALGFACGMFVVLLFTAREASHAVLVAVGAGLLSGVMSADAVWQAAENQYQLRLKKRDDPEWVPELAPGRRLGSLLVIAIGVLLFATGTLFLLLYFSASDEVISGTFLLIAFGCLVPALGAFYGAWALRQRERVGNRRPR